ncbi:hypothetical protein VNI00_011453 [Paramarasmius palmivorus]|uniref:F-box domain-containing protein n=1 Tax=Paramarasmius palmivorus TaxID=297713 RepID=A0AAW0CBA1_9AGAR
MSREPSIAQRLPMDVLKYLFEFFIEEPSTPLQKRRRNRLPRILSRVSSSWRAAALDMPELWAYLQFGHTRSKTVHLLYSRRLELSGNRPITLDIHADRDLTQEEVDLVSRYAHRIGTLIVNPFGFVWLPCALFDQFRQIVFPNITRFEYMVDSRENSLLRLTRRDLLAPFLMPAVGKENKIQWGAWPFGNITSLTLVFLLSGPRYTDVREMLERCKGTLQSFEFQGSGPRVLDGDDFVTDWNPIIFPALRKLVIGYVDDPFAFYTYRIQAPHLESLTIKNLYVCPPNSKMTFEEPFPYDTRFVEILLNSFMHHGNAVTKLKQLCIIGEFIDCGLPTIREFVVSNPMLEEIQLYLPLEAPIFAYYDAVFESNLQEESVLCKLRKLAVSKGELMLGFLRRRAEMKLKALDEVVLTMSAHQKLLDDAIEANLTGNMFASYMKNLRIIEDPIPCSYVSLEPFMDVIVDGTFQVVVVKK